eukprot:351465-Chlamydomonas_euryale.AAC.9
MGAAPELGAASAAVRLCAWWWHASWPARKCSSMCEFISACMVKCMAACQTTCIAPYMTICMIPCMKPCTMALHRVQWHAWRHARQRAVVALTPPCSEHATQRQADPATISMAEHLTAAHARRASGHPPICRCTCFRLPNTTPQMQIFKEPFEQPSIMFCCCPCPGHAQPTLRRPCRAMYHTGVTNPRRCCHKRCAFPHV